jgi:hypothetical protein
MLRLYSRGVIALIAVLIATPALSESALFETLSLAPGFTRESGQVTGNTGGSYSLPSIANSDRNGNACLGYGDSTPDHILVLEQNFSNLTVQVNSAGKDTTLVVRGPNKQIVRCGDDTGSSKDASVQDANWQAGTYEIWVGSIDSNQSWDYRLSVRE